MTASLNKPKLAPPGAGLPLPELLIARLLLRVRRWTGSRERFLQRFSDERRQIQQLLAQCPPAQRGTRVLIPRLRGLEDSSRDWSVWMTLDHLRITNGAFARVIPELCQERGIAGQASTAAVKPNPAVTHEVEAAFERSCDAVLASVARFPNLNSRATYAHPWFGSLNAFGWLAISASHMGIHRAQLERIIAGLAA